MDRRVRFATKAVPVATLAFVAAILASCATLPAARPPADVGWVGVLPGDSDALVTIDVKKNRALVQEILSELRIEQQAPAALVDRTSRLFLGVTLPSVGAARFSAVGVGSYPAGLVNLQLSFRSDWKREQTASGSGRVTWWRNVASGLQLAVPSSSALMISSGDIESLFQRLSSAPGPVMPSDLMDRFDAAEIAAYFSRPAKLLGLPAEQGARLPILRALMTIERASEASEQYSAELRLGMRSERDARLISVLFRLLAAGGTAGSLGLGDGTLTLPFPLDTIKTSVDGDYLDLMGITLSRAELVSFLGKALDVSASPVSQAPLGANSL